MSRFDSTPARVLLVVLLPLAVVLLLVVAALLTKRWVVPRADCQRHVYPPILLCEEGFTQVP